MVKSKNIYTRCVNCRGMKFYLEVKKKFVYFTCVDCNNCSRVLLS